MRVVNRLLTLLVGAVLVVVGVFAVVEGIWTWTNSGFAVVTGGTWLSTLKAAAWSDPTVIFVSVVVAVVGLVILFSQVRPQAKRVVPFRTDGSQKWVLLRRSTEAHLRRRLEAQVPVSPVKARLKVKGRRWSLALRAAAASSTRPLLESTGQAELATLHAPDSSRVKVRTTGATSSSTGES